ncbi:MAG: VOC family protein [Candidatus Hodarchaeales archaeon]|jgi:catechol 2,3-dioxygenase-like lactoylglutathione lyase family enzyme
MNAEPNVKQAVPFFAVSDMQTSLHFYVDGLGFKMTQQWVDNEVLRWCWLELGGAALMLQQYRTEGHDSWIPEGKVGEGVTIDFMCEDALVIYHEAKRRGLRTKQKPFVGNGLWVVTFLDPDGYKIEFESPTDVAEETIYSG